MSDIWKSKLTSAITINQYCLKNKNNHLNITEHPYIFFCAFWNPRCTYVLSLYLYEEKPKKRGFSMQSRPKGYQILYGTQHDLRVGLWMLTCYCFILYKEKLLTDRATIKSWNRSWARSALKFVWILV